MRGHIKFILASMMVLAFFALPSVTFAMEHTSNEAKIAQAIKAASPAITDNATIIDSDGTVLRKGTNGWTCVTSSPAGSHPMCNDAVWMSAMKAIGDKADFKTDKVGISYMLDGDDNVNNADPYDTQQDPGEVWIQEGPHLMIIVPDKNALRGITDDPTSGGPYVMWKDTPYAHIMVPVAPRTK